jgi:DNA repair protein SbcD/Mre11
MRIVHLADLHLGYRQYQRLTSRGINQREWDVADAFRRAVEQTIVIAPRAVLIAGDVFHTVRPTNSAILQTFRQLDRLRRALPETVVVMVAGNHDTPRTREMGGILRLFAELGVHVVDGEPQRLHFPEHELTVLAVPDVPGVERPALVPDPAARWNVLLLHGEVEGVLPAHVAAAERAAVEITQEELGAARWDYVALGHYHVHREVAPGAYYAGSIEYTSTNTWGELGEERALGVQGKGFVEHDLATGEHVFHHLPGVRALVDLPPVSARGMTAADLDAAIRDAVDHCPGGIDDNIVRLVVRDAPRHVVRELDVAALRDYKRRALHFHLDARRPEVVRLVASGAPMRRRSLLETVEERLRTRTLTPDLDRDALVALGLYYLREAEPAVSGTGLTPEPTEGPDAPDAPDAPAAEGAA